MGEPLRGDVKYKDCPLCGSPVRLTYNGITWIGECECCGKYIEELDG